MASSAKKKFNWPRRVCQLVSLGLLGEFAFYGVFRCPFAVPYVSCGACPVTQCPGKQLWIPVWCVILASGLVFGRTFCGWACPAGFVADLLGTFGVLKGKIKGVLHKVLSAGKYPVLIASVVVFIVWNNPRWAIPIRTGDFFNSVRLTFEHGNTLWLTRTIFILAAIGLGVLIPHLWCRFLCPTGGVLDVLNRFSPFRYRMTDKCNNCEQCRKVCPVDTRPAEMNCNNCGDCVEACGLKAIRFWPRGGGKARRHEGT